MELETQAAIKTGMNKRKKIAIVLGSVAGVLVVAGLTWYLWPKGGEQITGENSNQPAEADRIYYSRLTGEEVGGEAAQTQAATCVMIENLYPAARPQSGLADAGVVYEAIAEGGITRFMAVFQEAKPQLIGPVRSVRMHYAQWARPYNCTLAHAGGAADAIRWIPQNGIRDLTENYTTFWRDSGRYAPHNLYTSFGRLDEYNKSRKYSKSEFNGFVRREEGAVVEGGKAAKTITVRMSSAVYNPVFTYDVKANNYKRAYQSGGKHMDKAASGAQKQVAPDVLVAIKVNAVPRPGTRYQNYTTTGSGTATIFQNGQVISGKWSRASTSAELKLTDADGEVIPLNRGQVWISAYPASGGAVTWK